MKEENITRIKLSLKPMIENAKREKLLFRSYYQGVIMSPGELEKKLENNQYVWGPVNWELISPQIEYERLVKVAKQHNKHAEQFRVDYLL